MIEDGFVFDNTVDETIIEIRLVIKNFIKKYEYDYYETYHYVRHYHALSDWLRDVKQASFKSSSLENYGNESIGGNVIAVARSYISGRTVTITGDAGDNNCHVVAITDNHDISEYEIDPADRTRPISSEEPKIPQQPVPNDLESILDYYLKLEKYKEDYDNFIDNIISGEYEDSWVEYDDRINSFRIPQLVTWVGDSDTTFTLTNVPAGKTYKIYRSATSINTGELPGEFIFVGNITADMDQAGTTISLQ